jgi:hypothetical protein
MDDGKQHEPPARAALRLPPTATQCPVILCPSSIDQAVCNELQELGAGLLLLRGGASPRVHPSDCRNEHQRRSTTRSSSSQCQSCLVREGWLGVIGFILSPSDSARSRRFYCSKFLAWNLRSFPDTTACLFLRPTMRSVALDRSPLRNTYILQLSPPLTSLHQRRMKRSK